MGTDVNRTFSFDPAHCFIIAEVALSHDGSPGLAHAFIDAAASAGADAVKFQTHIAAAESTPAEPFRVAFSAEDSTRYDYWKRMEFTEGQWHGLAAHARRRGISFVSSPFSIEAVELLTRVGVPFWKIASGEAADSLLLGRILETALPIVVSTGLVRLEEIDAIARRVQDRGVPLGILQCTTMYPSPPEKIGLNLITYFRDRYRCAVGLSGHSATIYPGLAAATLGIEVLEVHLTLSGEMFGPDVPASLTTDELRQLVRGVRFIEAMRAHPLDQDASADEAAPLRQMFTKSVVPTAALAAGTVLGADHLAAKKPGGGMPPERLPLLVGRRLTRDVQPDVPLTDDDVEHFDSSTGVEAGGHQNVE